MITLISDAMDALEDGDTELALETLEAARNIALCMESLREQRDLFGVYRDHLLKEGE